MADRRSTYVFPNENDYNDARDHICRQMNGDYYDSNKIHFYGSWGSCSRFNWDSCWRIDIYNDCTDAVMAASIFKEHGGKYYDNP